MIRSIQQILASLATISLLIVSCVNVLAQVPSTISFQGVLLDEEGDVRPDGTYELTVFLYNAESGGSPIWTETQTASLIGGVFSAQLGAESALDIAFDEPYWLSTSVDGAPEVARIALSSVPYSLRSASVPAEGVGAVGGLDGQVLTIAGGIASWQDPPDGGGGTGGTGDITSVAAGEGLAGGAIVGDATLSLDTGFTDGRYVSQGAPNAVTSGMIADNAVETNEIKDESVTPPKISGEGGSNGQVLTLSSGVPAWVDPPDPVGGEGDITAVTAGVGLSGGAVAGDAALSLDTEFADDRYVEEGELNSVTVGMVAEGVVGKTQMTAAGATIGQVLTAGDGGSVDWKPASGGTSSWRITGNTGTTDLNYLGTSDGNPLELRVNSIRALRVEPTPGEGAANIIGGAINNRVTGGAVGAVIGGGSSNQEYHEISADYGTISGGFESTVEGEYGTVGGGDSGHAGGDYATVAGGRGNAASGLQSAIGGGLSNEANGTSSTIGGGEGNQALGSFGTIAGGQSNQVVNLSSTVSGGFLNKARQNYATVSGGETNDATGVGATIVGGSNNVASGSYSTILGGSHNTTLALWSTAAGRRAKANHQGTFVWADRTDADFASTNTNQFLIRAGNGVGINTGSPSKGLTVSRGAQAGAYQLELRTVGGITSGNFDGIRFTQELSGQVTDLGVIKLHYHSNGSTDMGLGVRNVGEVIFIENTGDVGIRNMTPAHPLHVGSTNSTGNGAHVTGGGVWTNGSSREFKTDFREIDNVEVLDKLAALSITDWAYKGDDASRHIGPIAEDFADSFGLGGDERYIGTVDADGVTMAAVQALYEMVKQQQSKISRLENLVEELQK